MTKKIKALILIAVIGIVCILGGLIIPQFTNQGKNQVVAREETIMRGNLMNSLSEEGTVSVTTDTTAMDLNVNLDDTRLDLSVEIEEVLVRAGENVAAGQPLFVIDQESLNKALDTLDDAYTQALLEAKQAELDLALGEAKASGTKAQNLTAADAADLTYENTVASMQLKLISYQKAVEEKSADLDEKKQLAELYNLRRATLNNMNSTVTYYEEALESLQDFYDAYNEDNADYKSAYNTYKNKLENLKDSLETAESQYDYYLNNEENSENKNKYYQSYMSAIDSFNEAVNIINKYQSVIDEYDDLEDRIEDAQTCLAEAKEKYNEFKEDYQGWYGNKTKVEVDREVRQMELDLEEAKLTLSNYENNYENNLAKAQTERDSAVTTGEIAELTYSSTINKLQQQVISTRLSANNLKAYLDEFNRYLENNVIVAPCDGLITNISFAAGDEIDLTYQYITIAQNGKIKVTLNIDQDDITNIFLDQRAVVTLDASGKSYEGWVDAISVSPAMMGSPTVSYTITVIVEDERLTDVYEGMSCNVDLVSDSVSNVLTVSKRAVITEAGKSYVKVKQQDGSSVKQEVTLGFTDGVSYEVLSGLNEGDIVLIESQIKTNNGGMNAVPSSNVPTQGGMPNVPQRNS
ncbi:MAG: efflux RND transporter periplasmic adaptor subunit [Peptococcaceae bacterium]|nr:efflux RND transporter periplasmic adaptor subunit [Peptococcaceae bacterium]